MYRPWVYRLAWMTTAAALLPIAVGALVTSLGAGMAFPDWPTSHGHNMLAYPWLQSVGDEFIEHGHRLAGMLVGMLTLLLTGTVFALESRRWVKVLAIVVLLGVITQGALGGIRVLAADKFWAMIHGTFAACIFSTMAVLTLATSRGWLAAGQRADTSSSTSRPADDASERALGMRPFLVLLPCLVLVQFILGGLVRHQGQALHAHLGMAIVVALFAVTTAVLVRRLKMSWLNGPAAGLLLLVATQLLLGAGAWVTKYGFPMWDYVAIHESTSQILFRSAHTVVGMLLLMTSVVLTIRFQRWQYLTGPNVIDVLELPTTERQPGKTWAVTGGMP